MPNPITGPGTYLMRNGQVTELRQEVGYLVSDEGFAYSRKKEGNRVFEGVTTPFDIMEKVDD